MTDGQNGNANPMAPTMPSSALPEDDWLASLPSWGDPIKIGPRDAAQTATPPIEATPVHDLPGPRLITEPEQAEPAAPAEAQEAAPAIAPPVAAAPAAPPVAAAPAAPDEAPITPPVEAVPTPAVAVPAPAAPAPAVEAPLAAGPTAAPKPPPTPEETAAALAALVGAKAPATGTAPPAVPGSTLGLGPEMGAVTLSSGLSLPAIDPSRDAKGLTDHSTSRTTGGFPVAPAPRGETPPPLVSSAYRNWTPPPSHGNTVAVWFLVFMPIIMTVASTVAVFFFAGSLIDPSLSPEAVRSATATSVIGNVVPIVVASAAAQLLYFIVVMVLSFADRRALFKLGHTSAATPWWNLLGIFVYLIARSVHVRRVTHGRSPPLTVFIILYIAPFVALLTAWAISGFLSTTNLL